MKVLGQSIDAAANLRQFLVRERSLVALLLLTAALDVLSTMAFMSVIGVGQEYNWIVRQASRHLGIFVGPAVGKLFQLAAVAGLVSLTPRMGRFVCAVAILVNLLAFVLNMYAFTFG